MSATRPLSRLRLGDPGTGVRSPIRARPVLVRGVRGDMVQRDFGAAAAVEVSRRMVAAVHRPGGQAQFITRPLPEMGSGLAPTCAWAIAQRCGLGTAANLRLHLARDAGTTPTGYRTAFRGRSAAQR